MPVMLWIAQRRRRQQTRKALQMLALSGVVRPSHVEPRYCVPLITLKTLNHSDRAASIPPPTPVVERPVGAPAIHPASFSLTRQSFGLSLGVLLKRLDGLRVGSLAHFCSDN